MSGWNEKLRAEGFVGVHTPRIPFHISLVCFSLDKEAEIVNEMNNSTLQLGIGGLPSFIESLIADSEMKKTNAHSEMFMDTYVDLYEAGKLTGKKNVDRDKA